MNKQHLLGATCLAGALVFTAPAALAQNTAAPGAGVSVEEVIVTAQRRTEKLQDVPISITAVSGATLEKSGVQSFRDLQTLAPAFKVSNTGVFVQVAIRGITSTALGPGIENNVAVYVDGFYQPDSTSLGGDFANVDSVQILKGPQGTLYGRNATGGALIINTREPNDERMILDASAQYGNLDDRRLRAYVGLPITKGVSLGIGAYTRRNDGYIRKVEGGNGSPYKNDEYRIKLKLEPTPELTFVLGYTGFFKSDAGALAYSMQTRASPALPPIGPLRTNQVGVISMNIDPQFKVRLSETNLKSQWASSFGTLTSYTSYADERTFFDNDYDATKAPFLRIPATLHRHTFQEAVDFAMTPSDSLSLTVGGLYFHDNSSIDSELWQATRLYGTSTAQNTRAWALYADGTWQVMDKLYVTAGLRYSKDKRLIRAGFSTPPFTRFTPPTRASYDAWTPRLNIRYEIQPDTSVYASYSKGFKSGLFNSTAGDTTGANYRIPVRPEKIDAFEVGFKTARSRYHFEAAAYYYDYKDLQVTAITQLQDPPRTATVLTNAATAEIYGVEASLTAALTEQLNVRVGGAYTHARYDKFTGAGVTIPGASGLNVSATQDFSGLRMSRAPDWTFNIGADYTIPVGDGKVVIAANGYYSSKYAPQSEAYNPVTGEPYYYQIGYFQANATIDWTLPGDHVTVGAYVNNLTDERFRISSGANPFGTYWVLSAPRTYGVKVGYKY
jgi:iron complex outermembrane receptor protein